MKIMIPIESSNEIGVRGIISVAEVEEVVQVLGRCGIQVKCRTTGTGDIVKTWRSLRREISIT